MAVMYQDEITLETSNKREAKWRIARLHRVIGYLQALMDKEGDSPFFRKIKKLHDHEGTLTVYWKKSPTKMERRFFKEAWASTIADGCGDNVEHELVSRR